MCGRHDELRGAVSLAVVLGERFLISLFARSSMAEFVLVKDMCVIHFVLCVCFTEGFLRRRKFTDIAGGCI